MSISATAKGLLAKKRQEERAWQAAEKSGATKAFDALPAEEQKPLLASAMVKIRAGLRANYHTLSPELRTAARGHQVNSLTGGSGTT